MENRHYRNCAAEGLLCAVMLYLLEELFCSVWLFGPEENVERDLIFLSVLCVLVAVLCGVVFWRVIRRVDSGKGLWGAFVLSTAASVVGYLLLLTVMKLVLRISLLPMRELGNGDGLFLMWVGVLFVGSSLVVHLVVLAVQALLRKKK